MREIANIILGRGLDIFAGPRGLVKAEQQALAINVMVGDFIVDRLLPIVAFQNILCRIAHRNHSLKPVV